MRILFLLSTFAFILAGCVEKHASEAEAGVQVVEITVGSLGYSPSRIELQAGIPARLIFTRTSDAGCTEEVHIPDFDIGRTALPMNEPVAIAFTPSEPGSYTFACWMNMIKGTLIVRT